MLEIHPSAGGRRVWASMPVNYPTEGVIDAVMASGYVGVGRGLGLQSVWIENGQRWFEFKISKC